MAVQLRQVLAGLDELKKGHKLMDEKIATIQQDQAAEAAAIGNLSTAVIAGVTAIQDEAKQIGALTTQVADLKAQLAAGTPVTAAQLDAIDAAAKTNAANIKVQTDALLAALNPAPTPAP